MADNNPTYVIETPAGHVLHIQAPDEDTARATAQNWHDKNSSLMANIKDIPTGAAYGLGKGGSTTFSSLGKAGAAEAMAPELIPDFPSPEKTFENLQKNYTGPLAPPTTPLGNVTAKATEMMALNPLGSVVSPLTSAVGAGSSAVLSELGKYLTKGTPYETPTEIALGVAGPSIVGGAVKGLAKVPKYASAMFGGVNPSMLSESYKSGTLGGGSTEAQAFRGNITRAIPQEAVIPYAEKGLANLKQSQSANYNADMLKIENKYGATQLSFDPVEKAIDESQAFATRYGQPLDLYTQPVRDHARSIIGEWRANAANDPRLQTPYGMDGLKRKIWNEVVAPLPEDTSQHSAAMTIYHGVKKAITDQAPEYKDVMQHYEESERSINNLERTLSLSRGATDDTTLRKLQSAMNDNVNTNFGQRAKLIDVLEENGAPGLKAALAGQHLRPWLPKSAAKWADPVILGTMAGQAAIGSPTALGTALAVPFMSPRISGNVAHGAGRVSGYLGLPEMLQGARSPAQIMTNAQALMARKLMEGQQQ